MYRAGEKGKVPIYSVHIHPDGSRLATGGIGERSTFQGSLANMRLDGKIRIWSTKAIYDPLLEESEDEPKLLCTLSTHTG
jgi:protein HIRA/HIR1